MGSSAKKFGSVQGWRLKGERFFWQPIQIRRRSWCREIGDDAAGASLASGSKMSASQAKPASLAFAGFNDVTSRRYRRRKRTFWEAFKAEKYEAPRPLRVVFENLLKLRGQADSSSGPKVGFKCSKNVEGHN
ncbi:hypothetical protein HPP92_026439 [Vanilla planifolia]|uniref:Uncharacterized protein n=1 Tax=Vanilla planifolia TaxID=51239 RepID=A0A835PEG5_VANPL|nr:hypothetical protein HPP92_026439 [Vanilla planifolia]KAG0473859.1 hypothetical protein HPP92_015716 [Vanilla planifolia]